MMKLSMVQQQLLAFIKKHTFLLLFLLAIFIVVFRSWEEIISFTDELYIEDVAYGMVHGNSWIIPTINGGSDVSKPPLVYWITAPLYTFFPVTPWTRRIPTMIFGLMLTWLLYQSAKHFYGKTAALWATLFLVTSAPFIVFTKAANFDLPNAFYGLLTLYLYNRGKSNYRYLYLAGISLGLGILTRSFLALFPVLVIGVDYLLSRKRPPIIATLASCLLTFLIILPWHFLAYQQNSTAFIDLYLRLPLLYHAAGKLPGDNTYSPLFYFFIFVLFPPSLLAVLHFFSKIHSQHSSIDRQLFIYCFFIFLSLSLSSTRHEWYIFPIYPALSILAGAFIAPILSTLKKQSAVLFLFLLFVLTSVISPLSLFLSGTLPQADSITALGVMEKNSTPQDTLYLYRYTLITATRFFPKERRLEIIQQVDEKMLEDKQRLFLLIRTQDVSQLSTQIQKRVLYRTDKFTLFELLESET